ncbi:DUF6894 family protein [Mangrovicella endophytica]|uniref:DUF6894 family protein n=1 Tax=Mangrovicella endophytica TaxID=2066697 RepID=UPI000C9E7E9C|nr:hypothetical protein [Mangrovicella endophytica]
MTRYFFNLTDGTRDTDDVGTDLDDDQSARLMAIQFAGELMQNEPRLLDHGRLSVDVSDQSGATVFIVEISLTAK